MAEGGFASDIPDICELYWTRKCSFEHGECDMIHLCSYFLQDPPTCEFGTNCNKYHSLKTDHNKEVLKRFPHVDIIRYRQLVRDRKPQSRLPKICHFYYKVCGCHNGDKCDFLHLCNNFFEKRCKKKHSCAYNHNIISQHNRRILKSFDYDLSLPPSELLRMVRSNIADTPRKVSDDCVHSARRSKETKEPMCQQVSSTYGSLELAPGATNSSLDTASKAPKSVGKSRQRSTVTAAQYASQSVKAQDLPMPETSSSTQVQVSQAKVGSDDHEPMRRPHCQRKQKKKHKQQHAPVKSGDSPNTQRRNRRQSVQSAPNKEIRMKQSRIRRESEPVGRHPQSVASGSSLQERCERPVLHSARSSSPSTRRSAKNRSEADELEKICVYNLSSSCSFGSKCQKRHTRKTFLWQYSDIPALPWQTPSDEDWMDLTEDQQQLVEDAFCEPRDNCEVIIENFGFSLDFAKMCAPPDFLVRRLTTPSKGREPHLQYATQWLWYYQDEDNTWAQYPNASKECNSKAFEAAFTDGRTGVVFKLYDEDVTINFLQPMVESRVDRLDNTKLYRKVIRRPISASVSEPEELMDLPADWRPWDQAQHPYILVELDPTSVEFTKLNKFFRRDKHHASLTVKRIERLQNSELYRPYHRRRSRLAERMFEDQMEQRLYFTPDPRIVHHICKVGFELRISRSCKELGGGIYFTESVNSCSSKSHSKEKQVFLANVLLGEVTKGKEHYMDPPPKNPDDPLSEPYDSCVDDIHHPTTVVVFEVDCAYPNYVITYQ